jgi:hypothetical protein
MKKDFLKPSPAELYALHQAARRQRSEEVSRLLSAAARQIRSRISHAVSTLAGGFRHA